MRVWTVQPVEVYNQILEKGYFVCDGRKADKWFRPHYKWLAEKMKERIGKPPRGVTYPIWAWYIRDWKNKKPDLRSAEYGYKGKTLVCIELEIPDNDVVLTDFDNWHSVLNKWYLDIESKNEEEWDKKHEEINSLPEDKKKEIIEKSWDGIFDIEPVDNSPWNWKGRWVQATFWILKKEYIKKVQYFTAR